jgi:hypothetical protein
MPAPDASLSGPRLLAAVTEAMVAFHQRYYHRKPVTATICRRVVSAGAKAQPALNTPRPALEAR